MDRRNALWKLDYSDNQMFVENHGKVIGIFASIDGEIQYEGESIESFPKTIQKAIETWIEVKRSDR
jgi:hypothetical protein